MPYLGGAVLSGVRNSLLVPVVIDKMNLSLGCFILIVYSCLRKKLCFTPATLVVVGCILFLGWEMLLVQSS